MDWNDSLFEAKNDPARFFSNPDIPCGAKAHIATELALLPVLDNERQRIDFDGPIMGDNLPRWPIPGVDHLTNHCGGGYGLSVILGSEKCGKTFLALGSCIEAAATMNWQVVYLSAELDMQEVAFRIGGYLEAHPACYDAKDYLHVLHVGKGQTPDEVRLDIELSTRAEGPPLLICMDSINTIAEMSGRDYLRTLRDYSLWAMVARRMSNGAASFLIVSETNKLGQAKGGNLQFWADQVVKLEKQEDKDRIGMVPVKMTLLASRRTGGEGPMGLYLRNHKSGRFQKHNPVANAAYPRDNSGSESWQMKG
jgi:hypothetical protein